MALSLNGGTPVTTTTTDANGSFSFGGNLFVKAGDALLIYVNDPVYKANLVGSVLEPVSIANLVLRSGQVLIGNAGAVNLDSGHTYSSADLIAAKGSLTDRIYYSVDPAAGNAVAVNGNLNIAGKYAQDSDLTVTGDFAVETGGQFRDAAPLSHNFSVGGNFSVPYESGVFNRYTGTGSANDPYAIRNVYDLQAMKTNLTSSFKLDANLDASKAASWNNGLGFEPIGNSGNPFTGSFDGNGKVISNLEMHRTGSDYLGLFGNIGSSGSVSELGLEDVSIYGGNYVGGLAGLNAGSLSIVYTTGVHTVSGVDFVGGLVGSNTGSITNAYSSAHVAGTDTVGGLVGTNSGIVDKTYAMGYVTGATHTGGLVGSSDPDKVTNSFWDKKMTGQERSSGGTAGKAVLMVADAAGYAVEDPVVASDTTSPDMMKSSTYKGWGFHSAENPDGVWVMDEGGTYPHFQFRYPNGVRGVGGYVYLITTIELVNEQGVGLGIFSTTVSLAGSGQAVDLYYSNDEGVSKISLDYSTGTGASSRYYGVLDKSRVGDTAFVIAESLNGDSKMLAKSGSVFPLDVWQNENRTLVRPDLAPNTVVIPGGESFLAVVDRTIAAVLQNPLLTLNADLARDSNKIFSGNRTEQVKDYLGWSYQQDDENDIHNANIEFAIEVPPGSEPVSTQLTNGPFTIN